MKAQETLDTVLASRTTRTNGRLMLIRRESARKNETPAFGIRCEVGPLQHGLWWQREEFARSAFAAAN
jgi:hypothetical protein